MFFIDDFVDIFPNIMKKMAFVSPKNKETSYNRNLVTKKYINALFFEKARVIINLCY